MDLDDWQKRLEEHFSVLRVRRSKVDPERPVFGLEHGLKSNEITDLKRQVKRHIRGSNPSPRHWLVWIVYSSEIGYGFAGDEYWQTFEDATPGWVLHGKRRWIRQRFQEFHKKYGGAEPSGSWAEHFSIICWPITNAILPKDLQRHMARVLYEARHAYSDASLTSPLMLGRLIEERSGGASARFQQLAQSPMLVGQIAAALLLEGQHKASLIHPVTLRRIREDLDRAAQAWLRSARASVKKRFKHRRLFGQGPGGEEKGTLKSKGEDQKFDLQPRFILRPVGADIGPRHGLSQEWDAVIEIPDLTPVANRFSEIRGALEGSRCRISGTSGRPVARGGFLRGTHRAILKTWPRQDEPLLRFESSNKRLDFLIKTVCRPHQAVTRLFRISSDGLAYEQRSLHVRAKTQYILLGEGGLDIRRHTFVFPIKVRCVGVECVLLNIPETVPEALEGVLEEVGVLQAGTVMICPAGLAPCQWDGEGGAVWLTSDSPCVGVWADHDVTSFTINFSTTSLEVTPSTPGSPVFIQLPKLGVGRYLLQVFATASRRPIPQPGELDFEVREPRSWCERSGSQGALMVIAEPSAPTLEQLWDGDVDIELHGPAGKQVRCTVSLFKRGATSPSPDPVQMPALTVPVDPSDFMSHLERHFKKVKAIERAYDLAQKCTLRFHAEEIGAYTLVAEREFLPLRWAVTPKKKERYLKLIDDTGADGQAEVFHFGFATPDKGERVSTEGCIEDIGLYATGGLYLAQCDGHRRAVIVPNVVKTLQDLQVLPTLRHRGRSAQDLLKVLDVLDLWANARIAGAITLLAMRAQVLTALLERLFGLFGGGRWAEAERVVAAAKVSGQLRALNQAIATKREEVGLFEEISKAADDLSGASTSERIENLAHLASRFLPSTPVARRDRQTGPIQRRRSSASIQPVSDGPGDIKWLAEFALRLASRPGSVKAWAGEDLGTAVTRLMTDVPGLARAARFMVLTIKETRDPSVIGSSYLFEGWDWQ